RDPFPDPLEVDVAGDHRNRPLRDHLTRLANPQDGRLGKPLRFAAYPTDAIRHLSPADRGRLQKVADAYFKDLNPYIAHIVRRRREFLENEIDPVTREPFLPKVEVRLFGDDARDALTL